MQELDYAIMESFLTDLPVKPNLPSSGFHEGANNSVEASMNEELLEIFQTFSLSERKKIIQILSFWTSQP